MLVVERLVLDEYSSSLKNDKIKKIYVYINLHSILTRNFIG